MIKRLLVPLATVLALSAALPASAATRVDIRITENPSSLTLVPGATAIFHVRATGYTSLRWQLRAPSGPWTNTGSSSPTLIVTATAQVSGYSYRALLHNATEIRTSTSATLGVYNVQTTASWSGYETSPGSLSAASASWQVPFVSCAPSETSSAWEWVGLSATAPTNIEQLGTATTCVAGVPTYFAWYEAWGDSALNNGHDIPLANFPVAPGDTISATISFAGAIFTYSISDGTQWSFTTTQSIETAPTTAEYIVEDPLYCSTSQVSSCVLDDFSSVSPVLFTNVSFTSTAPATLNVATATLLEMVNGSATLSAPSPLTALGSAFVVTSPATDDP